MMCDVIFFSMQMGIVVYNVFISKEFTDCKICCFFLTLQLSFLNKIKHTTLGEILSI
jgi:hypothetical protein